MKYTCPNCGKHFEMTVEQLTVAQYHVNCPQCGSALEIVGDYAYMPLEDGTLNLADDEPEQEEQQPGLDPLYDQVVAFLGQCNAITPVMLAVRFGIDMERAEAIMQQLEDNGIVGPAQGGAPRTILIPHNTNLPYGLPDIPTEPQADGDTPNPNIKTYTMSCSTPGCILFLLLVAMALVYFLK